MSESEPLDQRWVVIDGALVCADSATISVSDEGFLRGDGAYEVLRAYRRKLLAQTEHLDRLQTSCERLRLPCRRAEVEADIDTIVNATSADAFDLWIGLTRGGRRILISQSCRDYGRRLTLTRVDHTASADLGGAKTLSYAANMLATRVAQERGFDEALLVSREGVVLEAPTASVFWVSPDGTLCTPPLTDHILDSITRRILIRVLDVQERRSRYADVLNAKEIFLASTTREVQAVDELDGKLLPAPGDVTAAAAHAYRQYVDDQCGQPNAHDH